jgi:hypothetical protein
MLRHTTALSLSLALVLAGGSAAVAQESTTRGFNLGLHLQGSSLEPADGDRANAGGAGIILGYGFNRTFELFLQIDGAQFDVRDTDVDGDWRLGHGDLGVRFHFANSLRTWVPYLQTGLTFRVASVEDAEVNQQTITDRVGIFGGALMLGGGVMFYFNQTLALDLQLAWTGGEFTEAKIGDVTLTLPEPYEARTSRINIGISWWP